MDDPEIRELLDTLVTLVDEKRHHHSQASESWLRRANDAKNKDEEIRAINEREHHILAELELAGLVTDMRSVIAEAFVKESS